jgi:tRNA(fMet)-specific endonuclease VapC
VAQLVDSSIVIGLERRGQGLRELFTAAPDEALAIASITASELLVGAFRADTSDRRQRRLAFVEAVFDRIPVVPFDLRAARVHAHVLAVLTASGRVIGPNDLLIAASALAEGCAVLTENIREFERVPGLIVRRPVW